MPVMGMMPMHMPTSWSTWNDHIVATPASTNFAKGKSIRCASAMVEKIVGAQVSEGSFDECAITFREIAEAKEVLCARLRTVYHTRIQYPE